MSRLTLVKKVYEKVKAEYDSYINGVLENRTPVELANSDLVYDYIIRDCMTYCFSQMANGRQNISDLSVAGLNALLGIENTLEYCCRPEFFAINGDDIYDEIVKQANYAAQYI